MRKQIILLIAFFLLGVGNLFSQENTFMVQGHIRNDIGHKEIKQKRIKSDSFTFDSIKYWIGEGDNKAALVIDWYDEKGATLVWGFKWSGVATGFDMIEAIAKEDPRVTILVHQTNIGKTLGGIGFNLTNNKETFLRLNGKDSTYYPVNGVVYTDSYNYDDWNMNDSNNHWRSGWSKIGYWSYFNKEDEDGGFSYASMGASGRELSNGSYDGWGFCLMDNYNGAEPKTPFKAIERPIIYVGKITLDTKSVSLEPTDTYQLRATITPIDADNKEIIWSSTDTTVASIDNNGLIEAISQGNTSVVATTKDGNFSDTCFVFVELINDFTFDSIKFWIGEGSNKAALVIDWNNEKESSLVWGYKWDGEATGLDMVLAIAKRDPRLLVLTNDSDYGKNPVGFGFNLKDNNENYLILNDSIFYPINGEIESLEDDIELWTINDTATHWQSGWATKGYWSYMVKESEDEDFTFAQTGASKRILEDGSFDSYAFCDINNWDGAKADLPFVAATYVDFSGINNIKYNTTIAAYPTFTNGEINIKLSDVNKQIKIIDSNGRIVRKCTNNSIEYRINISDLKAGLYIVSVDNKSVKIIKQ